MLKILVIDDNLLIRKLIRSFFVTNYYVVEEANNGLEGLKKIKKNKYDLIITDILMPKMEGLELIMHLRRDFPELKIIAISGGKPYYLYMAKKLGSDGVFTKPLDHTALLETVKKLLAVKNS